MGVNLPVAIKKVFLSFIQNYYATEDPRLVWNVDKRLTRIFIGDKFIAAPEVIEKMPSIILSRGQMMWAQTAIDQLQSSDNPVMGGMFQNKKRTDLVRGNVTFQCISQNGIEAETIANTLFLNLVGYKDQLRANGIHQIMGVSMGEESVLRSDVAPRLVSVPVNVVFTAQVSIATTFDLYLIRVLVDETFTPYAPDEPGSNVYDNWFAYAVSGNTLMFSRPPASGANITTAYTGKYTLQQYLDVVPSGVINGINTIFTLPEEVYTTYTILSGIILDPYKVNSYVAYTYS